MSLGDDGNRPSVSEPRWRGCGDCVEETTDPCEGYEVVGCPETNAFRCFWHL